MNCRRPEITSLGVAHFIVGVKHTKAVWQIRGRLMFSFSIAQVKISYGVCEVGTTSSLHSDFHWSQHSVDS